MKIFTSSPKLIASSQLDLVHLQDAKEILSHVFLRIVGCSFLDMWYTAEPTQGESDPFVASTASLC